MSGVCANCWGSKGGRLFTVQKRGPRGAGADPAFWRWGCSIWAVVIAGAALSTLRGWI